MIYTFCSIKEAEVELLAVLTLFVGGGEVDCSGFAKVDSDVEDFVGVWIFSDGTIGGDTFCSEPLATFETVEVPASTEGPGPGTLGDCVLLDKAGKVLALGVD